MSQINLHTNISAIANLNYLCSQLVDNFSTACRQLATRLLKSTDSEIFTRAVKVNHD